uniref:restriction endonuclease subunit S n=1 Tax=Mariniflexile sp. TaxID=1979402 RepID=UPI0040471DB6
DLNDVGKSIEIVNLNNEKLLSGLHTLLGRPKEKYFHIGFNGYLFLSNNIRLQIKKEAQGTKVSSISVKRISNLSLIFPSIHEQEKISSFLKFIDDRIQTQNEIIGNLESLKDGLIQKIFSKKLRLKDENNKEFPEWEMKKGNGLFETISNKNHNSELPILAISQEFGAIPREHINYNISVTGKSIDGYQH